MQYELNGPVLGNLMRFLERDPDIQGMFDLKNRVLHQCLYMLQNY